MYSHFLLKIPLQPLLLVEICVILQFKMRKMKKILVSICTVMLLTGCANEFNKVYKSQDYNFKYEYAKECFANGKYVKAITLLEELVTIQKGTCLPWQNIAMVTSRLLRWDLRSIIRPTRRAIMPRWLLSMPVRACL